MNELLNSQLCRDLRNVINETDIFIKDEEENKKFNLICTIMDRFDSAIEYINTHLEKPKTETEFIVFMTFCCTIKDGINYIMNVLNLKINNDKEIFKDIYMSEPLKLPEENNYDDDKFFEYFRSLVFAHPFLTDRSIPNKVEQSEIQYSPFVLINSILSFRGIKNPVGVKVYSNKRESFSIIFSFDILKEYIKWKYEMISDVTEGFKNIIKSKEEIWKKRKVNRSLDPIETLKDVKSIMEERYIETFEIEELITYLECKNTKSQNVKSVELFKNAIINIIPTICDAVDNYDHAEIYNIIGIIIRVRPNAHAMMHYQLEKIYCYLNEYESSYNIEWGLRQAEAFSKEFAKKWVNIDPYNMEFDEIKMLTSVACYLEYQEQNKH